MRTDAPLPALAAAALDTPDDMSAARKSVRRSLVPDLSTSGGERRTGQDMRDSRHARRVCRPGCCVACGEVLANAVRRKHTRARLRERFTLCGSSSQPSEHPARCLFTESTFTESTSQPLNPSTPQPLNPSSCPQLLHSKKYECCSCFRSCELVSKRPGFQPGSHFFFEVFNPSTPQPLNPSTPQPLNFSIPKEQRG